MIDNENQNGQHNQNNRRSDGGGVAVGNGHSDGSTLDDGKIKLKASELPGSGYDIADIEAINNMGLSKTPPATSDPHADKRRKKNSVVTEAIDTRSADTEEDMSPADDEPAAHDVTRRSGGTDDRKKRIVVAVLTVTGVLLILIVLAYFLFLRGSSARQLIFSRRDQSTAKSGGGGASSNDATNKEVVTREEMRREMQPGKAAEGGAAPPVGENLSVTELNAIGTPPTIDPAVAQAYRNMGSAPVTDRPPINYASTVSDPKNPTPEGVQSVASPNAHSTERNNGSGSGTANETVTGTRTTSGSRSSGGGPNTEHSIRADDVARERSGSSDQSGESESGVEHLGAREARAPGRRGGGGFSANGSNHTESIKVPLPPLGTMLPVRTVGTIYTLRAQSLVRMQLTRAIDGSGWKLARGTEFFGSVRGSDYEVGRAYIQLIGFIDPTSKRLVRLSGQMLGGDGTEGLHGRKRRVSSRWTRALRIAGAGALDAFATVASSFGRRPVIISDVYGTASDRSTSPLLQEINRSADGSRRAGFVEVAAGTPGYALVLTMPQAAQGVDATTGDDADSLAGMNQDDVQQLALETSAESNGEMSEAELAALLENGSNEQIRRALPRMSSQMRRVAEIMLNQKEE